MGVVDVSIIHLYICIHVLYNNIRIITKNKKNKQLSIYYSSGLYSTHTHTHTHTQDIGVQGYSTLHCIRGAVEIQPIAIQKPISQVESALAQMNISQSLEEPPTTLTGNLLHVYVYIYMYYVHYTHTHTYSI